MRVKGSALRARVQWVKDRGMPAYARLLTGLSQETRAVVDQGFSPFAWYPMETFIELCVTVDRLFGKGDLLLCEDLGRYACDANLTTLYKMLYKLGNIHFILRRAALAWSLSYDEGELKVVGQGDHSAALQIAGITTPHRAHCLSVKGWVARAGELSGARDVVVTERCRVLGASECEMRLDWSSE
jgi:hypothetical protein